MEAGKISSHEELVLRIVQLKNKKLEQEEEIRIRFREFSESLNPLLILKESLHELVVDKDVQMDLVQAGLNLGANALIDTVLGKKKSLKGFLSSLIAERISASYINKLAPRILSGISRLMGEESG